jgi:mycothiol synthase
MSRISPTKQRPLPLQFPPLSWRDLAAGDAPALRVLELACKQADGDEWVSRLVEDAVSAASGAPGSAQCGCLGGQIAAAGWVSPGQETEEEQLYVLGGKVHPAYRRRGIGAALLGWAENEAMRQAGPDLPVRLVIRSETLTPDAHAIYTRAGFAQLFVEQMMVLSLDGGAPPALLPDTLTLLPWNPETNHGFYQAYAASFRDRPGFPDPPEADWLAAHAGEAEFLPELSMLAVCESEPVGFVACEIHGDMGWVSQMGVVPARRGQGLAGALLAEALRRFRLAGYSQAGLHVNLNNPRAIRLYERLGFQPRLQRARYAKAAASNRSGGFAHAKLPDRLQPL